MPNDEFSNQEAQLFNIPKSLIHWCLKYLRISRWQRMCEMLCVGPSGRHRNALSVHLIIIQVLDLSSPSLSRSTWFSAFRAFFPPGISSSRSPRKIRREREREILLFRKDERLSVSGATEISACPATSVASSSSGPPKIYEVQRGCTRESRSLASGELPRAHVRAREGAKSRDRTERGTPVWTNMRRTRITAVGSSSAGVYTGIYRDRKQRGTYTQREKEREKDRIGFRERGPWKSTGRRRVHIRRVFTVRLYRSAAAEGESSGREGRSEGAEGKEFRSASEGRWTPGQPFGSRGAHNAAIVSRAFASLPPALLLPLPPSSSPSRLPFVVPAMAGLAAQFRRASDLRTADRTDEFFISRYPRDF